MFQSGCLETTGKIAQFTAKISAVGYRRVNVCQFDYYPAESTGLATGILITALHQAGLATLTHTPSPMKFLNETLDRPESERPFLLLVVGYPADDAEVPDIKRKALEEYTSFIDV